MEPGKERGVSESLYLGLMKGSSLRIMGGVILALVLG